MKALLKESLSKMLTAISSKVNKSGDTITGSLQVNGGIVSLNNIVLGNAYWVYGKTTDQTNRILLGIQNTNQFFCGFGMMAHTGSESFFDAYKMHLRSNTTIDANKTITVVSDLRYKQDIEPLNEKTDELLLKLKPFTYKWDKSKELYEHTEGINYGLGAQEVAEAMESVGLDSSEYNIVQKPQNMDECYTLSYTEFIPMLIHLAQSQQKEIDELKAIVK